MLLLIGTLEFYGGLRVQRTAGCRGYIRIQIDVADPRFENVGYRRILTGTPSAIY